MTMVDSSKGRAKADPVELLQEKVHAIEQKLDALSTSVDARFDAVDARLGAGFTSVDERFNEVTLTFVEQREYTDFAFERLRNEMQTGFGRLERKLDMVIDRLGERPTGS